MGVDDVSGFTPKEKFAAAGITPNGGFVVTGAETLL